VAKHFVGIIGALLGAFVGVWLLVAPSALAYQPEGATWADPTFVDFWTGLPLTVISGVGLILYSLGLAPASNLRGCTVPRHGSPHRSVAAAERCGAIACASHGRHASGHAGAAPAPRGS
jgi:hypothetical protein